MRILFHTKKAGYIISVALVFLAIFFTVSVTVVNSLTQYYKVENYSVATTQASNLAEAGVDKAFYELNQNPNYTGETDTALSTGTFSVSISSVNSGTKSITVTGYVPNSSNPISSRTIKVNTTVGQSVISFRYGVQTGSGGFVLAGGATVNGSIYSNGSISATGGTHITGAAVAANPPSVTTDQSNDTPTPITTCSSSNCVTFSNSNSTEDFAQSFKISTAVPLNNIQLYIKKVSTPVDATVRIVTDNAGSPSATTLLSGTLLASSVTTSFGWVSVTLPTTPILDPSQTYWIVIDASSNTSKYYVIGANANGYQSGIAKIGKYGGTWNATSPTGLDGYFKIYLGGGTSMIGGNNYSTGVYIGTTGSDDAWANKVAGATVTGTIYCQTGSPNNKSCNTSRPDPTPQPLPLADSQIQEWKDDAASGGTINGDYTVGFAGATLGPKRITGNLVINGGGTLTVSGTLWVEGNITLTSGGKIKLALSYGSNSGAIISDGYVSLTGGSSFAGSGQAGSYPFLVTTSACPAAAGCNGNNAIYLSGGAGTVALIAQNGTVQVSGGSALKQVTAKQVMMDGGATLYYDSGLISENFSSGPGGSWEFIPGTYVIVH